MEDGIVLYQKYIGTYLYIYEEIKPSLGHEEVIHEAKEATCTEFGWSDYVTCTRCNYTTYEEISALNHEIVNHEGLEATCESNGYYAYDACTRCSYSTYKEINMLGHDYKISDITKPTKDSIGSVNLICGNDNTHIKTIDLPILTNENYEITIIEPVSCLATGLDNYLIYIEEFKVEFEVVLDALGHDLIYFDETNSTCKVNGHNAYEACKRCNHTTKVEKDLLEHIEVIDKLVEPTKDTTGLTQGSHCSECGDPIIEQQVLYYFDISIYNEELGEEVEYEHNHLAGDKIELTALPDEGRGIAGWYLNGKLYSEELTTTFTMPSRNTTLELRYTVYPNMDIWFGEVASSFESGDGTADNPYIIKFASQFAYFERVINQNELKYNEGVIAKLDLNQKEENLLNVDKMVYASNFDCMIDYISYYKAVGAKTL